ncbi:hypothetical protein PROFUN_13435 [Planoprotostelium fungivorum]|uniref:BRCT domain-containing protein n=1 Tax=Planoprotostelium fungivorum TaxID=1890364 RepID=A0A2P6N432_9EUKA|nr:hypothetical protein PROFUN_13435 [Planoprotostelium fungivorum]
MKGRVRDRRGVALQRTVFYLGGNFDGREEQLQKTVLDNGGQVTHVLLGEQCPLHVLHEVKKRNIQVVQENFLSIAVYEEKVVRPWFSAADKQEWDMDVSQLFGNVTLSDGPNASVLRNKPYVSLMGESSYDATASQIEDVPSVVEDERDEPNTSGDSQNTNSDKSESESTGENPPEDEGFMGKILQAKRLIIRAKEIEPEDAHASLILYQKALEHVPDSSKLRNKVEELQKSVDQPKRTALPKKPRVAEQETRKPISFKNIQRVKAPPVYNDVDFASPVKLPPPKGNLTGSVFLIQGKFQLFSRRLIRDLIYIEGGEVVRKLGPRVTHVLYEGDCQDETFKKAEEMAIHIVDEHFIAAMITKEL